MLVLYIGLKAKLPFAIYFLCPLYISPQKLMPKIVKIFKI